MKKLLYITYDWWFDTDVDTIKNLCSEYEIQVFVISIENQAINKYPQKNFDLPNIKVNDFPIWSKNSRIKLAINSFKFVLSVIKKVNWADLILYIDDSNPFTALPLSVLLPQKKTIVTFHDYIMHGDEPFFKKLTHCLICKMFKSFHFYSKSQYYAFKNDFSNKKSFYTLMPLKNFGSYNENTGDHSRTYRFLFFGYIRDYKGLDLFIEAAKRISNPNVTFAIAGYCQTWDKYKLLIGNDNRFECDIKFIANENIPQYFNESDYLVLPYNDSTQSGPLLIAINYSLPVIASDHQIFKDFIKNGVNGYLFKNGDENGLYNIMKTAITLNNNIYQQQKNAMLALKNEYLKESDFLQYLKIFLNNN